MASGITEIVANGITKLRRASSAVRVQTVINRVYVHINAYNITLNV